MSSNHPSLRQWLSKHEPFDCALNPSFLGVFAHTGCAGALQQQGLLRSLCGLAGASAGAHCGAIIASGSTVLDQTSSRPVLHDDLQSLLTLGDRRWQVLDPALGLGVLEGRGLEEEVSRIVKPTFEELNIPFACTAFSMWSRRTEILKSGPLPRAVRASCAVPVLIHPTSHERRKWLLDGGIGDPSGSVGLRALPEQPKRSLHIIVNRRVGMGLDSMWTRSLGPSQYGARREEVVTLRLNNPPTLFFGDSSFRQLGTAVELTADAVLRALDAPLQRGHEDGHWVAEVDVAWGRRGKL
ncbi:unnamed protein product [Prorocentrum cordatum]|uniref:PNPLA domain-containing protein n=1 Tax=Prorocentrum cordatum TaxID=2364126 RepID=A0ABN9T5A2_9DINO|nr:unnamed protein product [Polarella glacialis]